MPVMMLMIICMSLCIRLWKWTYANYYANDIMPIMHILVLMLIYDAVHYACYYEKKKVLMHWIMHCITNAIMQHEKYAIIMLMT